MQKFTSFLLAGTIALAPATVVAEDAQSILKTAFTKQAERWDGVDAYVIDQTAAGLSIKTTMRRTTVEDNAGNTYPIFVPETSDIGGMATLKQPGSGRPGMQNGVADKAGKNPWVSMDPRVLNEDGEAPDSGVVAQEMADSMNRFMRTAALVGTAEIDGRKAYHLKSDTMNIVEPMNGEEFRLDTMNMWMDTKHYVPLRMTMEGTISSAAESRPTVIETQISDYRDVPGSNMYESYRQVVRMGGMMNDEQKAQMKEAQAQLAEFEKQLASMPASQRQMMESMMGSRMEQFRQMASGGDMEFETVVNEIRINPAP